jgi:hypothetical protein
MHESHMITNLEANSLQKTRVAYGKGPFPPIQVLAEKFHNKKLTNITGLEPFLIDMVFLEHYI